MKLSIINEVREKNPLIHHLTNNVVINFTANGLLSFGGSPIMAKAPEDAGTIASVADGVLLNIGTIKQEEVTAMIEAGRAANKKGSPVVLDPVGVGASSFRSSIVKQILKEVHVTAIKGNAGELAYLVNIPWDRKGVESIGSGNAEEVALKVANTFNTTAIITGETDIVCNGEELLYNKTGHPILTKVTGAGCLLGSIVTTCLTTEERPEVQALTAVSFYGLAAEYAYSKKEVNGPGTFLPHFIDALGYDIEELRRER
ncbi:hydroxyethylthiazole kinase [Virgibacillus halodenitrificans]|nr:hydroxyethylthiazole kinase [Virgibacillus halodenitrificans]MCJ0930264.1 hydroxyethylthiazole kinase [Virgibacillus halodenitrificans]